MLQAKAARQYQSVMGRANLERMVFGDTDDGAKKVRNFFCSSVGSLDPPSLQIVKRRKILRLRRKKPLIYFD